MGNKLLRTDLRVLRDQFIRETEQYITRHWDDPGAAWRRQQAHLPASARRQQAERLEGMLYECAPVPGCQFQAFVDLSSNCSERVSFTRTTGRP
jgi:hypothetical protein